MGKKSVALLLCVLATTIISKTDAVSVKCKGVDVEIKEETVMEVKECFAVVGVKDHSELNAANAGCFSKCVMQKKGMIDATGKPHKEKISSSMGQSLPDFAKGELMAAMEKCLDTEGPKVDATEADKECKSFLPLSMCAHQAFMSVCKS